MSKNFSVILILLVIVFSLLGGFMAGLLLAPNIFIAEESDQNKIVTIEKLRVVDENDKLLIELGAESGYGLSIYGQKGSIKIYTDENGPNISILDNSYQSVSDSSYQSVLESILYGSFHTIVSSRIIALQNKILGRAYISVFENEGARIGVDDKDSKGNAEMSVSEYGGRFDAFSKADNISRASIWVGEYGYGGISLLDKDGYRLKGQAEGIE